MSPRRPVRGGRLPLATEDLEGARPLREHWSPRWVSVSNPTATAPGRHGPKSLELQRMRSSVRERLFGRRSDPIKIDRYTVLNKLGNGGMGVVYAAYDPELDRRVAVKLLRATSSQNGTSGSTKFRQLREAQAIAKVGHPNVIHVYDTGTHDDQVFIAMELVSGATLGGWLKKRLRSTGEILEVLGQAGRGLAAAHEAGLVHRDFKPANVLVGRDGRARVVDFGLARPAGEATASKSLLAARLAESEESTGDSILPGGGITQTGAVLGTPAYMAPEQHQGRTTDERTDQFAFCVVLYEALYQRRPFRGDTPEQLAQRIAECVVTEPTPNVPVPKWIWRLIQRGLSKNPNDRFPSMNALLQELGRDPTRKGRLRLTVGASLVLVGGVGLATGQVIHDIGDDCVAGNTRLEGTWDATSKLEIQQAFMSSGQPYAVAAWRSAAQAIDAYATEWAAAYDATCLAVQDGTTGVETFQLSCLDERLLELETLTTILVNADSRLVGRAPHAAQTLNRLADCTDARRASLVLRLPDDPALREQVQQVRLKLAEASLLFNSSRMAEASEAIEHAEQEARALGHAPVLAEALFAAGVHQENVGNFDRAEVSMREALRQAKVGRHEYEEARCTLALGKLLIRSSHYEEAEHLFELAQATIDAMGGDTPLQALHSEALGNMALVRGDYELAESHYGQTLLHAASLPDHAEIFAARLHARIAITLRQRAKYSEAIEEAELGLKLMRGAVGPMHSEVATMLIGVGNVYVVRGQPEAAIGYFEEALEIGELLFGQDNMLVGHALNDLGTAVLDQGRYGEAEAYLVRARAAFEASLGPEDQALAHVYNNLAAAALYTGRPKTALAHFQRGLRLREDALGPDHPKLSISLRGIGRSLARLRRPREAITSYRRALEIGERALDADHPDLVDLRVDLADALLAVGRPSAAIEQLERARASGGLKRKSHTKRAKIARSLAQALRRDRGNTERIRALRNEAEQLDPAGK